MICVCNSVPLPDGKEPETGMKVTTIEALIIDGKSDAKRVEEKVYSVRHPQKPLLEHILRGKVIDKEKALVVIGKLIIEVDADDLPKDIKNGDFVEFRVDRLDCSLT